MLVEAASYLVADVDIGAGPEDREDLTTLAGGMLHENLVRREEIASPSNRRFGLTIGAARGIVGGIRALTAIAIRNGGWALSSSSPF